MCGIITTFDKAVLDRGLDILKHRGRDGSKYSESDDYFLGHTLHAIVGHVPQPITAKGTIVANCEIYNWKFLAQKYELEAQNDVEVLVQLLDRLPITKVVQELDGVYAFVYKKDNLVIATRDLLGVKPLWYTSQGAFASEKKVCDEAFEVNPKEIITYNLQTKQVDITPKKFFENKELVSLVDEQALAREFHILLKKALLKRIPDKHIKVGILLSGGVDSTLLAKMCTDLGMNVTCYTAGVDNPDGEDAHDTIASQLVAQKYSFNHKLIMVHKDDIEPLAKKVTELIEEADAVKVAVGMPFYVCAKQAASDGCKVLFSGLGAEEIMAGYKRHKDAADINDECLAGLSAMHTRDLYRDDVLTMDAGVELRLPFLDKDLVRFCLQLPAELKIKEDIQKYLLRLAALDSGLDKVDAFRPKKAAQYGSKFDRALKRLANSKGMKRKEYLEQFS